MEGWVEGKWGRGEEDGGKMRGKEDNTCTSFEISGKRLLWFLLSSLHFFAGPRFSLICFNVASLQMPSLSLALKTESSFLLKSSARRGLLP